VVLRRPRRDNEAIGDLGVRQPVAQERQHLELAAGQTGPVRLRAPPRAARHAQAECPHLVCDLSGERRRPQRERDGDRLGERVLVAGEREHERAVVRPPCGAERLGRRAPIAAEHRLPRRRRRGGQRERARDREIVARPDHDPRRAVEPRDETIDERGLADSGLAGDDHHSTPACRSLRACRRQRLELRLALEQLRVRCHTRGQRKTGMPHAQLGCSLPMPSGHAARTVERMLNPLINEELLRGREAELARKLRHAHHTSDLPPTVLESVAARIRNAVFRRNARARSVAGRPNLGSAVDAGSAGAERPAVLAGRRP
jgi:hypothetical protein